MKRAIRFVCCSVLWTMLPPPWSTAAAADRFRIVTTTSDLACITRAVVGDLAEVRSICMGGEDPHMLQARPSFVLAARNADLWVRIGMDLEVGWENPVIEGSRNRRIRPGMPGHLDASERVLRLDVPAERVTRDLGDVHPHGNPHYWLDPHNGRIVAETIAARIAEMLPAEAPRIAENLQRFKHALDERMFGARLLAAHGGDELWGRLLAGSLDEHLRAKGAETALGGWLAAMRPWRGKPIVTFHKSWVYFASRFGIDVVAELEPKPGIPPGGTHLVAVEQRVREHGVSVILQEPFYSRKAARRVADRTGARVVVVANSVGGEPEASDYLALLDLVIQRLNDN